MAACRLTIELNDATPRTAGEPISGVVIVTADKDVACKGLIVRTIWSTHGRGNIDTGEVATQTLFEGNWQAGQEVRYPFTLATAVWPPTYYGDYMNVGHYVTAQAKLSWAIDPKTQVEFQVIAKDAPESLEPTKAPSKPAGLFMAMFLGLLALLFLMAFIPLLLFIAAIAGPIAGAVYFWKFVLPKRITGPVTCELASPKVRAGENVKAKLEFTPARRSTINGIEWKIRCYEECVSGSGSNRQTHTSELFQDTVTSCGTKELKAGEKQSIDFVYQIPANAAPSLKFTSNNLKWTISARIDIPSWPDWTKKLEPIVVAHESQALKRRSSSWNDDYPPVVGRSIGTGGVAAAVKTPADEAWLEQVIAQIQQTQHDEAALATVLNAVKDFDFPIHVTMEEEIDTPEFSDEEEFSRWDDAEWWSAYLVEQKNSELLTNSKSQEIEVALAWLDGYPPEVESGKPWSGRASIVGYAIDTKQLLMQVTG